MAPSLLASPAPYHIITYGTLLGTSLYQSFVNGIVSYKALPRPQFATLQTALTPVYFAIQSALPCILALTYPGTKASVLLGQHDNRNGVYGVFEEQNRWTVLLPMAGMLACGLLNLAYLGPVTTRIMKERKHQETRDGKKYYDDGPHSQKMQSLNKQFARMHGGSAMINLVGTGMMLYYGVLLSGRIQ